MILGPKHASFISTLLKVILALLNLIRVAFDISPKGEKKIFFPDMAYSTDNGAMIAYIGWLKSSKKTKDISLEINPNPSSRFI